MKSIYSTKGKLKSKSSMKDLNKRAISIIKSRQLQKIDNKIVTTYLSLCSQEIEDTSLILKNIYL